MSAGTEGTFALHPFATLSALADALGRGDVSSVEVCELYARRIEGLDARLGAFRIRLLDEAMEKARRLDAESARGARRGPLHGVPYAAKDLFDVEGLPTTAGCRVLEAGRAASSAHVIERLDAAGMVLLGKTNTVQFAYGGAGINTHHGTPHNPWHATPHLPGGSSSGSGVAVSAGLAPMALGTDTGGSVRIPAALCGITGLKTTVGRVSRQGVYPLSWSLDSVGPLSRTARDTALAFDAMNGAHSGDTSTHGRPAVALASALGPSAQAPDVKGLRVGIPQSIFFDDADPELVAAVDAAAQTFRELGARVDPIPFTQAADAMALNPGGLVIAAEAYTLNRSLVEDHFDALDPIVSHRIIKGRDVRAEDYLRTVHGWNGLREDTMATLSEVDVLICPTTMITAQPVAPLLEDIAAYSKANLAYLRNTSIGNILNLCGLSLPAGLARSGLPLAVGLYAKSFDEATLLRAGAAFQHATDHHLLAPDLDFARSEPMT